MTGMFACFLMAALAGAPELGWDNTECRRKCRAQYDACRPKCERAVDKRHCLNLCSDKFFACSRACQ